VIAGVLALALLMPAAEPEAVSCQRKIDEIKYDKAKPGAVYRFTASELNAWARQELPKEVPQGMRQPSLQLGTNTATGHAIVDFLKMQHAKGAKPGWLMEKLIDGERPMKVTVEMKSANGYATVYLRRVEISSISAGGSVLQFLIQNFFRPLYPEAHIDEAFEMGHNVDRVEVRPDAATVYMKRTRPTTATAKR
jgi:hypothetical protein